MAVGWKDSVVHVEWILKDGEVERFSVCPPKKGRKRLEVHRVNHLLSSAAPSRTKAFPGLSQAQQQPWWSWVISGSLNWKVNRNI